MRFSRLIEAQGESAKLVPIGPDGRPVDVALAEPLLPGGGSSREQIADAVASQSQPVWVRAPDLKAVRAAAECGAGAILGAFENADDAASWTTVFDAALTDSSAGLRAERVNTGCGVIVPLPEVVDDAVGLVERYRQAGVTEMVVTGEPAGDVDYLAELIGEFDDEEVRADAAEREARVVPPASTKAPGQAPRRRGRVSRLIQRSQESALRRMSDAQVNALLGNRVGVRLTMRSIAARFRPEQSDGFVGTVEFSLKTARGVQIWSIDCDLTGAEARFGRSEDAALRIEAELADFLRVGTGEIAGSAAVLGGRLHVRGDFGLALRMGKMFGGPTLA